MAQLSAACLRCRRELAKQMGTHAKLGDTECAKIVIAAAHCLGAQEKFGDSFTPEMWLSPAVSATIDKARHLPTLISRPWAGWVLWIPGRDFI